MDAGARREVHSSRVTRRTNPRFGFDRDGRHHMHCTSRGVASCDLSALRNDALECGVPSGSIRLAANFLPRSGANGRSRGAVLNSMVTGADAYSAHDRTGVRCRMPSDQVSLFVTRLTMANSGRPQTLPCDAGPRADARHGAASITKSTLDEHPDQGRLVRTQTSTAHQRGEGD